MMGIGEINDMNALKTVLAACINGISVLVFVVEGRVAWHLALPMAAIAVLGGYLGAISALRIGPRRVRAIVIAIGFGLATYYFLPSRSSSRAPAGPAPATPAAQTPAPPA
jgi:uncharacterized membrane protein YfcA